MKGSVKGIHRHGNEDAWERLHLCDDGTRWIERTPLTRRQVFERGAEQKGGRRGHDNARQIRGKNRGARVSLHIAITKMKRAHPSFINPRFTLSFTHPRPRIIHVPFLIFPSISSLPLFFFLSYSFRESNRAHRSKRDSYRSKNIV